MYAGSEFTCKLVGRVNRDERVGHAKKRPPPKKKSNE